MFEFAPTYLLTNLRVKRYSSQMWGLQALNRPAKFILKQSRLGVELVKVKPHQKTLASVDFSRSPHIFLDQNCLHRQLFYRRIRSLKALVNSIALAQEHL